MTTTDMVARAQTAICPGPGAPGGDRAHQQHRTAPVCRQHRFPLEPLRRMFFGHGVPILGRDYFYPSDVSLARLTGTHLRQIQRWKHEGGIPERAADRIACHVLGVHPSAVWSEWLQ